MSLVNATSEELRQKSPGLISAWLRWLLHLFLNCWKFIIGVIFCMTPVTAILVLGWQTRFMRRQMIRTWYRLSPHAETNTSFKSFAQANAELKPFTHWPNWFVTNDTQSLKQNKRWIFSSAGWGFGSFWTNLKLGLQTLATLALATLPFSALWIFAWWGGWDNSFNKGYEQSFVGPSLGITGIFLFMAIMTYLPMALAHQAAHGNWKAFFNFAAVRAFITQSPWAWFALGLIYGVAALPILFCRSAPVFIEEFRPDFADLSPEQIQQFAKTYYFWTTVYIFTAFIFLRKLTAGIYARSALALHRKGFAEHLQMGDWQTGVLNELKLSQDRASQLEMVPYKRKPSLVRRIILSLFWIMAALMWFALAAQIFISQFFNYHWTLWLTHPLIQLPWLPPLV